MVSARGLEPLQTTFVASAPVLGTRRYCSWSGRRDSNPCEWVGSPPRSHYATPALISRASPPHEGTTPNWRPRPESNRLDAALEAAPITMTSRPSIAPGWLTGVEPANTGATTRRSSSRASATPQRSHWSPASASSRLARATRARPLRQRAGPSPLEPSARIERATSALPMRRSASRTSTAHVTGADDGARTRTEPAYETGALPLAHRPHTPLAEPTGFEPAISCVTGRRANPRRKVRVVGTPEDGQTPL
jgi:hypothetical protein